MFADNTQASQEYWKKQDLGSLTIPRLLLERRVPRDEGKATRTIEFVLEGETVARICDGARQAGVPERDFLLGCWAGLLGRLNGDADLRIDVNCGSGGDQGTRAGANFCTRFLPLRFCGAPGEPITSFAQAAGRNWEEAERWKDQFPEQLVSEKEEKVFLVGFEFSSLKEERDEDRFKLRLSCCWSENERSLRLHFTPALVDESDVRRMGELYLRVLMAAALDTSKSLDELTLVTDEEREQVVREAGQTAATYHLHMCAHELFERQVERTPDRIALVFDPREWSYRALNAKANQTARLLQSRGVLAKTRVGLFMQRSDEMIIALLAILKAGGSYVALHPDLPKARLAHQLRESETAFVVTQTNMLERLPDFAGRVLCMDAESTSIAAMPGENLGRISGPKDEIYVIYTSGSTGIPKGVSLRHENVVNYTQSICLQLGTDETHAPGGMHFANVSTYAADLGNTPIYAALASGGCLHMIDDDVLMDGSLYAGRCQQHPIDVLKIAPSHLEALLDSGDPRKVLPRKYLVVGGEVLRWDMVRRVHQFSDCAILNHYAPTECTIGALTFPTRSGCPEETFARVAPLGRPVHNMVTYVLDQRLNPVPVGVPGELYIGGAGVSNGYVNRPDLTAERFLLDPLNPASGRTFYRSGDRARILPGGAIEFLGRTDDQVKVRGFRVELGEIEAALARYPAIERAVVGAAEKGNGDHTLVAFLLAPAKPTADEVRQYLRSQVPDYMVPSKIEFLETYPLNANGKVDRRRLLATMKQEVSPSTDVDAGETVESKVAAIWREVLGASQVGPDDNFFDLGGHSLLATQVIARIRERTGAQIPLRAIFESPTVRELSGVVEQELAQLNEAELTELLDEVEGLSEEELRSVLGRQS